MLFNSPRPVAAALAAAVVLSTCATGFAQSADQKPAEQPRAQTTQPADPNKDNQAGKRVDEFAEAARVLGGPAAHPECMWIGRTIVGLLYRNDLDTAFRHLELYDRFGCPAGHIQATFRCFLKQGDMDMKALDTQRVRAHACWINPNTPTVSAQSPQPAQPGTTSQ